MAEGYAIMSRIVINPTQALSTLGMVQSRISGLNARIATMGRGIVSNLGTAFFAVGGALGIGRAIGGVISLQGELQTLEMGIGSLLSVTTGDPLGKSMKDARFQVKMLRGDASEGVGELRDYVRGFQTILMPGLRAGMDTKAIRELNKQAIAAGFLLRGKRGISTAPMDIIQALERGVSDRITPVAIQAVRAIGMTADEFRDLDKVGRLKALQKGFAEFASGVTMMGTSWEAQWETLVDNIRDIIRAASGPIFERWIRTLRGVNVWFHDNKKVLMDMVDVWGVRILNLWDKIIGKAMAYAAVITGAAVGSLFSASSPAGKAGSTLAGGGSGFIPFKAGAKTAFAQPGASGLLGNAGTALRGLFMTILRFAGPMAIVSGLALSVVAALEKWPGLMTLIMQFGGFIVESFMLVADAFVGLTAKGSALANVGLTLLVPFILLAGAFGLVVRGIALVVEIIGLLFVTIGTLVSQSMATLQMLFALATGDMTGGQIASASHTTAQEEGRRSFQAGLERIRIILGKQKDIDVKKKDVGGEVEGVLRGVTDNSSTTNVANMTVTVQAEVNADPARVAVAFEEVIDGLRKYRRQGKRLTGPAHKG